MHQTSQTKLVNETPAETYQRLAVELEAILDAETFMPARYATAVCLLAEAFAPRFFWTGFYCVAPENAQELVVGPYRGTLGCLRIPFGKGVCGMAAETRETQVVDDVHAFPGHIACDSRSNSEIVVPVFDPGGQLLAVLDVDSEDPAAFTQSDRIGLERICALVGKPH